MLGVGEAHVRSSAFNRHLPAVMVAADSLWWTVALRMHKLNTLPNVLVRPKWRGNPTATPPLPSTGKLLRTLRSEVRRLAPRPACLAYLVTTSSALTKSKKSSPCLASLLSCAA